MPRRHTRRQLLPPDYLLPNLPDSLPINLQDHQLLNLPTNPPNSLLDNQLTNQLLVLPRNLVNNLQHFRQINPSCVLHHSHHVNLRLNPHDSLRNNQPLNHHDNLPSNHRHNPHGNNRQCVLHNNLPHCRVVNLPNNQLCDLQVRHIIYQPSLLYVTLTCPVRVTIGENWVFPSRLFHFMTNKIVHHDRNGHITSSFFPVDAMISSLAQFMSPQSCQKQGSKFAATRITYF